MPETYGIIKIGLRTKSKIQMKPQREITRAEVISLASLVFILGIVVLNLLAYMVSAI